MKKIVLSIVLISCLIVSMTSCDAIGDAVVDLIPEDIRDIISEIAPGLLEEPDVPEDNIDVIVNKINSGVSISSLAQEQETIDTENIAEQIKKEIGELCYDANILVKSNGEPTRAYAAIKDNVMLVSSDGSEAYVFIEDDMRLVSVSGSEEYGYYGDVNDELKDALEALKNGENEESGELTEDEEKVAEFITDLLDITLPHASQEDIVYEDGKYYLSDEYIYEATTDIAREILDTYYGIYPESTPDEIYDELEENISDVLSKMNIKLWINAEHEEITGFGFSMHGVNEDLCELDEDTFEEIDELKLVFDANGGDLSMEIYCKGFEEYQVVDATLSVSTTCDDDGMIATCEVKFDATTPYVGYDYDDDTYDLVAILRGELKTGFELKFDASKLEGGNALTVKYNSEVANVKAYENDYYSEEEVFSSELTEEYADLSNTVSFELTIDAEEGGEEIAVEMNFSTVGEITYDSESDVYMHIDITTTAEEMPSIPDAVYEARDEAIAEYDEYN